MRELRLMSLEVMPDAIVEVVLGRARIVFTDLPRDARIRQTSVHPITGNIHILLESPECPPAPLHQAVPAATVMMERV